MTSVFISHSSSDERIKKFFKKTIEKVGLKPILMEFENLTHKSASMEILKRIKNEDCKCLIVLLGKFILYPSGYNSAFTHNWVGCEIGLANFKGIDVVVFEDDSNNFREIVDFPVPFTQHYFRYTQDAANSQYIGGVLRSLALGIPLQNPNYRQPYKVTCTYDHCYAQYYYWNLRQWIVGEERMPCPVCRQFFRPGVDEVLQRDSDSDKYMPTYR